MSTINIIVGLLVSVVVQTTPPADSNSTGSLDQGQKPKQQPPGWIGEISTDNLYVRSGPSINFYTVTKLKAGNRVRVLDKEGDWLAITPPKECFSLMADKYIDTGDGKHGVVNGDNIRVRAGSLLNNKMYAIQMKLSRGAEVEIVGQTDSGFYRITPPKSVKLWVNAEYVTRIPEDRLAAEAAAARSAPAIASPEADPGQADDSAKGTAVAGDSTGEESTSEITAELTASTSEVTTYNPEEVKDVRKKLEALDAQLQAELTKPMMRRELTPFIKKFEALAARTPDEFAQLYAETRINQIRGSIEMLDAVKHVRKLREDAQGSRTSALAARAKIRPRQFPIHDGFDVTGELRPSAIYDSKIGPRRYRLVDPKKTPVRTLGYVEVPEDSGIKVEEYLGRYVGVRAIEIQLQTGDVDPIYVFVASEIVPLESGTDQPKPQP